MNDCQIYVYKCIVDDGGAPCVDEGLLTLAICKPYIRSTARKNDLIFAFGSNNNENPPNRLIYIATVNQRLADGQYYERIEFKDRRDCIYERLENGRLERRQDAEFHFYEEARVSDLGVEPFYPKANVLIAEDFRYFGKYGNDDWKLSAPNLRRLIEKLGQGHRVNFSPELLSELLALKRRIWLEYPEQKVLGKPLHKPDELVDLDTDQLVKVCGSKCYYVPKSQKVTKCK